MPMITNLVKFFVICITIPSVFGGGDSYNLDFDVISRVQTDMQGELRISGPRFTGQRFELNQIVAAVKQKAPGAVFGSPEYFPPAGAKVTDTIGGESKVYHVVALNTTPEMWVRPKSSGCGYHLMVRLNDMGRIH